MNPLLKARNGIIGFFYKHLLKPAFFRRDPEEVHDRMIAVGAALGRSALGRGVMRVMFDSRHPSLAQSIAGIRFRNPVGLAAGFDKNAQLTRILPSVGFGFMEVGSITGEKCAGNPGRHLWRLPKSKGLVVYYGLKNDGCESIAPRLQGEKFGIPVGISIAKTNCAETAEDEAGIRDYVKAYRAFRDRGVGDYFTLNISCPNAFGGESFADPVRLDRLLAAIRAADPQGAVPLFLKMPAELPPDTVDGIVAVARRHRVAGFICTNLAKSRANPALRADEPVPDVGGVSGLPVRDLSDDLIARLYRSFGKEFVIVGCGGIFSAEDAYRKIKKGASLLQMITGMIFEGPQVVSRINAGLADLLAADGHAAIGEAVGKEA